MGTEGVEEVNIALYIYIYIYIYIIGVNNNKYPILFQNSFNK